MTMPQYTNQPVILHGRAHPLFAESLSATLGWHHVPVTVGTFSDSETHVEVQENIEGADVYIVQPTSMPTNEHVMELLLIVNAAKSMNPQRITAVIPFYGYRRQEKRSAPGEALSFELVAQILKAAGVERVLVMDLHKHRSLHYFATAGITYDELRAFPLFVEEFKKLDLSNAVIVAPDKGRAPESEDFATALGIPLILAQKRRSLDKKDHVEFDEMVADVDGKDVIITDDEINTGGTLLGVTEMMKKQGARNIYVACTHAVLGGNAIQNLQDAPITKFFIADTIALPKEKQLPLFETVSVVPIFAKSMKDWSEIY